MSTPAGRDHRASPRPPGRSSHRAPRPHRRRPLAAGRAGRRAARSPPLPAHCRVKLVLKPTADSKINAELWLPAENWNGRFMAVGNGGFGGSIQGFGEMQTALRLGYATAGSDTGHDEATEGPGGMFALGHPEKIVDFAYRAVHEMTATSKKLIDRYYGNAPQFSYFKGCSTGGRQAVMAAQRYPEDFDGIIAGALANRHIQMHTAGVARSIELARRPEAAIPQAKAEMVSKAVMDACDIMKEGFLNNPRACSFDFAKLACKGADADSCLTAPQLKTVEAFYGGTKNSKGELIFSGQALGNPLPALRGVQSGGVPGGGFDTVRIWGFQDASYDWNRFDLDRDMPIINSKVGFVDAVDPDLSKFKARGGKLLLYTGWGDTGITPENTVLYYESVLNKMGAQPGRLRAALHGAGHGALPRRRRPAHVRHRRHDGSLAREERHPDADDGIQPAVEPVTAPLRVPAGARSTRAAATARTRRTGPAPRRRRPRGDSRRLPACRAGLTGR